MNLVFQLTSRKDIGQLNCRSRYWQGYTGIALQINCQNV